jgi:hypothetical protein
MSASLLELVLLGWLPGALIFRLPHGDRDRRAGLPFETRAFWAVVVSVAWSVAACLVLAAVHRYSFLRLLVATGGLAAMLLAVYRGRLRYSTRAPRPTGASALPLLLVVLGAWLYFPPSEYVMGGKDPGVYLVEGVQIAQRGALRIADPDVAAVPAPLRDLFFPSHDVPWYYGTRFMGFFIGDPGDGTVFGQFPHVFPASIAIGYGVNGLSGARQTIGVWAILGLLAVYVAAVPLVGRAGAFGAAALLGLNVVEVWFAKYPTSEVPLQALLFASFAAYAEMLDGNRRFFGPLAALLLSLQLFLRFDAIMAVAAVVGAAAIAGFGRQRLGRGFMFVLVPGAIAGIWYLAVPLQAYSVGFFGYFRNSEGWPLVAAALVAAGAARLMARSERIAAAMRAVIPIALASALAVLAVYAYFFRHAGGRLAYGDAESLRSFAWYVTRAGLASAVAGFAWSLRRSFWKNPALYLAIATYAVVFFYKARVVPEHFWMMRRFLTVVLPGAMIGIAALAAAVATMAAHAAARRRAPVAAILTIALLLPFAFVFRANAAPIVGYVEYAGLIPHLERLASEIGDDDLLIVESRNASDLHVLALPLAYVYARHVLVLNTPRPDRAQMAAFIGWAQARYSRVLFLGGGGTDLLNRQITATPLDSERFQVPEYASALNAYPSGVRHKEFDFGLYRLDATPQPPGDAIAITIGRLDDLRVVRFNAKELRPDTHTPFRWTRDASYVLLMPFRDSYRTLTVWMSTGGRPRTAAAPAVTLSLAGTVLGTVTPVDAIEPYTLAIPPDVAARATKDEDAATLRFQVPPWNPHVVLGAPDDRQLGVIVTRVEVR